MPDNADGVSIPGIVPPDLGPETSVGFQSVVHAGQRPYTRTKYRVTTMDGGGFQTAVKQEPSAGNLRPTAETND
jgi:hypothetical protein